MKIGIMQPYFFPYAQQFRHINQCDLWVIFDTPKFSRKSWVSRNRIINQHSEWSYISVPIASGASQFPISDAKISDKNWKKDFYDKLKIYNKAPYYNEVLLIVEEAIGPDFNLISDLNTNIMQVISKHLGIETEIKKLSELSINIPEKAEAGHWALNISKALGATIYSNAPGGRHLFDSKDYDDNGIKLEFYNPCLLKYDTPNFDFVSDLSVLDSLMWMGVDSLKNWCFVS